MHIKTVQGTHNMEMCIVWIYFLNRTIVIRFA